MQCTRHYRNIMHLSNSYRIYVHSAFRLLHNATIARLDLTTSAFIGRVKEPVIIVGLNTLPRM